VSTGGLARWDGASWAPIECAISGSLFSAAVNGSLLYVGGRVRDTCGIPTNGIGMWDSHRWRALGQGVSGGAVHAIALHHDSVYAGGSFLEAGGRQASRVARWDGADWHPLGQFNGDVHALAVFGEFVFAGGDFSRIGSIACMHVARFYSGDWVPVGPGVDGPVLSILPVDSCLYIGGSFSRALQPTMSAGDEEGRNGFKMEGGGDTARVVRWCFEGEALEAVEGVGQLLTSVRAMASLPMSGQCSSTASVC
jgi:hypothetical protein